MDIKEDNRGYLHELYSTDQVHIGISTIKPSCTRGNHYHKEKKEKIILFAGKFRVILCNVKTEEYSTEYIEGPQELVIDPFVLHAFTNTGDTDGIIIFMQDGKFDRKNPDTYYCTPLEVLKNELQG